MSVIIPTYNRARDIGRCLDSLVSQTFRDFEVLVCDDGSTDGTAKIVALYQGKLDLAYHWNENFGGPARPRNIGLRLARGTYVALLDSDDWWLPRKLEVSLKHLEAGADVVYHDLYLASRADQQVFWRRSGTRALHKPVFEDLMINGNGINNSSVVARKQILEAAGGFCEEPALIAAEDYDAWLQVARVTNAFVRIPEVLGYYWIGDGNLSNPGRILKNLDALEARYANELHALGARRSIYWLGYVKARSQYRMGSYEMAAGSLAAIRWRRAPLSIHAKSLWMSALIGLRQMWART